MTGAAIAINDASAADTVLSVKKRVFVANRKLYVRRQRLMYRPGPYGINPLADNETLAGAGVAQDGTAELDVLLADMTAAELDVCWPSHEFSHFVFHEPSICVVAVKLLLAFSECGGGGKDIGVFINYRTVERS